MCGRYVSPEEAAVNREYQIDRRNSHLRLNDAVDAALGQSFNVAPTQQVPVVRVIREPVEENATFAIAGLWDESVMAEGERMLSCTILTMPANELLARIHNAKQRMPAILRKEDIDVWLTGNPEAARTVLKPFPSGEMLAWPVSKRVNSARNDGPELIEPVQIEPTGATSD